MAITNKENVVVINIDDAINLTSKSYKVPKTRVIIAEGIELSTNKTFLSKPSILTNSDKVKAVAGDTINLNIEAIIPQKTPNFKAFGERDKPKDIIINGTVAEDR